MRHPAVPVTSGVPGWLLCALAYIGCVFLVALIVKAVGEPRWYSEAFWLSIVALFVAEWYLIERRLHRVRGALARNAVALLASLLLSLVAAYVSVTIVINVFGRLGWL